MEPWCSTSQVMDVFLPSLRPKTWATTSVEFYYQQRKTTNSYIIPLLIGKYLLTYRNYIPIILIIIFPICSKVKPHAKEPNCLYPGDLQPFTRRPAFVVVDSDNSTAFANIPRNFDQPLVVLMSPQEVPSSFRGIYKLYHKLGSK